MGAASSGIAVTLLEEGKTAHSDFKLPLNLNNVQTPYCNITKQSITKYCFISGESPMSHRVGFEASITLEWLLEVVID